MKNLKIHKEEGFTLVELMIVVAIIGILAAVAIPQFAAYRTRGFNSSGQSDVRNMMTSEAAFFSDWQHFGYTAIAAAAGAGDVAGATLVGPGGAATLITGQSTATAPTPTLQIPLGNGVSMIATTGGTLSDVNVMGKHLQSDTYFGADSASSAIYFCRDETTSAVGVALAAVTPVAAIAEATGGDDYVALVTAATLCPSGAGVWAVR